MKRGDIVAVVLSGAYGKPRPAVVVQKDSVATGLGSTVVCPLTSDLTPRLTLRINVQPSSLNGLRAESQIMVDKIQALPTEKVGGIMGQLEAQHLRDLNGALMILLDLP